MTHAKPCWSQEPGCRKAVAIKMFLPSQKITCRPGQSSLSTLESGCREAVSSGPAQEPWEDEDAYAERIWQTMRRKAAAAQPSVTPATAAAWGPSFQPQGTPHAALRPAAKRQAHGTCDLTTAPELTSPSGSRIDG